MNDFVDTGAGFNQRLMKKCPRPIDNCKKPCYTDSVKSISQKEAIVMTNLYGSDVVLLAAGEGF